MSLRFLRLLPLLLAIPILDSGSLAVATKIHDASPPSSVPTFPVDNLERQGFFYVGGHYVGEPGKGIMDGAMYVEVRVPKKIRHPHPVVFIHGAGSLGTQWVQTPDGRPGWVYYFLEQGYVTYVLDTVARGRSPYVPGIDSPIEMRSAVRIEECCSQASEIGKFPFAKNASQWPGDGPNKGKLGDPIFDAYARTQGPSLVMAGGANDPADRLTQEAGAALLDKIGTPVILITHSHGGEYGWLFADARPKLVSAIVALEPSTPPIKPMDTPAGAPVYTRPLTWGLTALPVRYEPPIENPSELQVVLEDKASGPGLARCWLQKEPARKLANLTSVRVLLVSSEAGFHREYDQCDAKWLTQAGVKTDFVRLEDVGQHGNSHDMVIEKNSLEIAKIVEGWMVKNGN
jgi:pimeloyl-ACP methyl ester carboxylesterase